MIDHVIVEVFVFIIITWTFNDGWEEIVKRTCFDLLFFYLGKKAEFIL